MLNLHEFACGVTNTNPHGALAIIPTTSTPSRVDPAEAPATAIVARAAATIGTDPGGSISDSRAFCGCVGLKQTWSRVSRYGVVHLADSLDHAGPITRTARDAAP
jgi:aspartyl-tRNA(Asn)/glutamyl-tRNA(Gln) amidotransferase subunit A